MLLFRHLAIGAVAAIVLSWLRGGFRDAPAVLFFFGLIGFLTSLGLSVVFRPASQERIDTRLGRSPRAHLIRYAAALVTILVACWVAGPLVSRVGFAGWLVVVLIAILVPLIVSLLAPGWHLAWAVGTATALTASLWLHNLRRPWADAADPIALVPEYFGIWIVAVLVAVMIALPRYLYLRSSSLTSRPSVAARTP
jgi:hypothetical protein